jgi:hypothetical protein
MTQVAAGAEEMPTPCVQAEKLSRDPVWITGSLAVKMAGGITWFRLYREALMGRIRSRVIEGYPIQFHRADCERLAKERRQEGDIGMAPNVPEYIKEAKRKRAKK